MVWFERLERRVWTDAEGFGDHPILEELQLQETGKTAETGMLNGPIYQIFLLTVVLGECDREVLFWSGEKGPGSSVSSRFEMQICVRISCKSSRPRLIFWEDD